MYSYSLLIHNAVTVLKKQCFFAQKLKAIITVNQIFKSRNRTQGEKMRLRDLFMPLLPWINLEKPIILGMMFQEGAKLF